MKAPGVQGAFLISNTSSTVERVHSICFYSLLLTMLSLAQPNDSNAGQKFTRLQVPDSSIVFGHINNMQSGLQRSTPGSIRGLIGTEVNLGDVVDSTFPDWFGQLLHRLPNRDLYMKNPRPSDYGPFWDFQIRVDSLVFSDSVGRAWCQYSLRSSGNRAVSGTVEFVKRDFAWYLKSIEGLGTLFRREIAFLHTRAEHSK